MATHILWCHLCREHRHKDGGSTYAKPRNDSPGIESTDGVSIDDLENATQAEDERAEDNRPTTSESCSDGPDQETTKKGAGLENRDAVGVDVRCLRFGIAEIPLKSSQGEHPAHYSSVIRKKERSVLKCQHKRSRIKASDRATKRNIPNTTQRHQVYGTKVAFCEGKSQHDDLRLYRPSQSVTFSIDEKELPCSSLIDHGSLVPSVATSHPIPCHPIPNPKNSGSGADLARND